MIRGKIIVTTQPADQAAELLDVLTKLGAQALSMPMIETRTKQIPRDQILTCTVAGNYDLLIFTSKKGVKGFFENLHSITQNYNLPAEVKIATVGKSTADELGKYNQKATYINPGTDANDLAGYLKENIIQKSSKVLLALGNRAPDLLQESLASTATVTRINVYETNYLIPTDPNAYEIITGKKADMCIFTSPSGFYSFRNAFSDLKGLNLAAIGSTTAFAIEQAGYKVAVTASTPSTEALVAAINSFFDQHH
jgi:uroporphyrinogen-III synthase